MTARLHPDDVAAIARAVAEELREERLRKPTPRREPAVSREKIASAKEATLRKLAKIRKAAPHG